MTRKNAIRDRMVHVALAALIMFTYSSVQALGLGGLQVFSNLDEPLNGVVELKVSAGEDVDSIVANIARREDFERFGIEYPSYLQDIVLNVENTNGKPVLRLTSNKVIIKEPFIHFLIRVDWAEGSFLREYTALIDPPVYADGTPSSVTESIIAGGDTSTALESEIVAAERFDPIESDSEAFGDAVDQFISDGEQTLDAEYGPVQRGETLTAIARELSLQYPDLSIYQIMRVLFEENRDAFINENINGLRAGAVLNISNLDTIRAVDVAQAKQFFYDQLTEWDPSVLNAGASTPDEVSIGGDQYEFSDDLTSDNSFGSGVVADSFQVDASIDAGGLGVAATTGDTADGEVVAMRQQISQLETALTSSSLENQELIERISILEGQLAQVNRLLQLEDSDLAAAESRLAQQNNEVFSSEGVEVLDDTLDAVVDVLEQPTNGLIEPFENADQIDGLSVSDEIIDAQTGVDTLPVDEVLVDTDIEQASSSASQTQTTPSVTVKSSDWLELIWRSLSGGLWKIIAGVFGVLIAILGLLHFRKRRSDREFDMLPDDSFDQRSPTIDNLSERETSFLTVYSESDVAAQAVDVDPIAESEVYIAYGRDEQAEGVLLDGMANQPDRIDIKVKLLNLYHGNSNVEGFERVAEEVYSQKDQLTREVWQDISLMGKDLSPSNPMFDIASTELLPEGDDKSATMITSRDKEQPIDLVAMAGAGDVNLINFEDDQSQMTDLDDVKMSNLEIDDNTTDGVSQESAGESSVKQEELSEETGIDMSELKLGEEEATSDNVNVDQDDTNVTGDQNPDSAGIEYDLTADVRGEFNLDDEDEIDFVSIDIQDIDDVEMRSSISHITGLELDDDYDEAQTQYELAKVFVELGDNDGARKILDELVAREGVTTEVLKSSQKLLEKVNSQ